MPDIHRKYDELISLLQQRKLLASCSAVLGWDEQTYLPPGGGAYRAEQLALLSGMVHDQSTSPKLGELLAALDGSDEFKDDPGRLANIREATREYNRATCLPRRLVEELSRVTTLAQQAWVTARKNNDYRAFQPWLEQVVALKREEANAVGFPEGGVAYDALIEDYEPGATTELISHAFAALRDETVQLVSAIAAAPRQANTEILTRRFPVDRQRTFSIEAARRIGFDFDRGRLDEAAHPFCSGNGPGDCRLTTRYDERFFPMAFFGTLHEAGHGIYEQSLNPAAYGTALGESISLGIHESQSRTWENNVGRSRPFWQYLYPEAQATFPEALGDVPLDDFYRAINHVAPSLIRVEADEVTYNLHIMLRFEIEQALIAGDLRTTELPGVWNEKFAAYFSMEPPSDTEGCLQDIHWSAGLIGYFPTYALGNMFAAQFFEKADSDLGGLDEQFARGEFAPLKEWLNRNIHDHGHLYSANELVEHVTGQPLSHEPLLRELHTKYDEIYEL